MSIIRKNFADQIEPLNHKPTAYKNRMTMAGYAYETAVGELAVRPAHGLPVAETGNEHSFYMKEARKLRGDAPDSVYMGAAGFINLGYMAKLRVSAAILFDINPAQRLLWHVIIDALKQSTNREDFIEQFKLLPLLLEKRLEESAEKYDLDTNEEFLYWAMKNHVIRSTTLSDLDDLVTDANRYNYILDDFGLADDGDYEHLKALAEGNAIATLTMDIKDREACRHLYAALASDDDIQPVNYLYVSNVLPFVARTRNTRDFCQVANNQPMANYETALENIAELTASDSVIIRYDSLVQRGVHLPRCFDRRYQAGLINSY